MSKIHKRKKVSIIGGGFVGSTLAQWLLGRNLCDIVLIDLDGDAAKGKALDLFSSGSATPSSFKVQGGSDYKLTKDSDIVVITAGFPRKPGMSRGDLLKKNAEIMKSVCASLKPLKDEAIFIVVSNPLDAMVYLLQKELKLPKNRVMGMAGVLDTARFKAFVSEKLNLSQEDIEALVLGGHGDTMVPLTRLATVGGVPLTELLSQKDLEEIVERTRKGGAEIVSLLKKGSAYYAPSISTAEMIEAILLDKKQIFPVAAKLEGEYGEKDVFTGVPCVLGGGGMEKVIEISLDDKEKKEFKKSVEAVRDLTKELEQVL